MDERLPELVAERVSKRLGAVVDLRHELHAHPEKGMDLPRTSARLRELLAGIGLRPWAPLLGSDVVAEIDRPSGARVCLRADMDALPIVERTGASYESVRQGFMHACGHDGHTSMLYGTALVLSDLSDYLPNSIRFVFQPGEEICAGGRDLVAAGACDGCDAAFALHGWPGVPEGVVTTREGAMFAAGIDFRIVVEGVGCHGGMPELGRNPIPAAGRIADALAKYHSEISLAGDAVLSVCSLNAGHSANVIPGVAEIEGTARYLDPGLAGVVKSRVRETVQSIAGEAGVSAEVEFSEVYDTPLVNTPRGYRTVRAVAERALPAGSWRELARPTMAMEDFAFYLVGREGAMFWLGLGEGHPSLHTPAFDFNDRVLATGITMLSLIALTYGCKV